LLAKNDNAVYAGSTLSSARFTANSATMTHFSALKGKIVPIPLKLKPQTTDTVLIGQILQTTAYPPSYRQNPLGWIVPLTDITGLPILMAT
jgi:hypothetical protein